MKMVTAGGVNMKTAREYAIDCYERLKQNGDLNTGDGFFEEHPQIKDRIISEIEIAIFRKLEE